MGGRAEQRDRDHDCESTDEGFLSRNICRSTTSVETGMTGILRASYSGTPGRLNSNSVCSWGVGIAQATFFGTNRVLYARQDGSRDTATATLSKTTNRKTLAALWRSPKRHKIASSPQNNLSHDRKAPKTTYGILSSLRSAWPPTPSTPGCGFKLLCDVSWNIEYPASLEIALMRKYAQRLYYLSPYDLICLSLLEI
jgi:hypothetical protein